MSGADCRRGTDSAPCRLFPFGDRCAPCQAQALGAVSSTVWVFSVELEGFCSRTADGLLVLVSPVGDLWQVVVGWPEISDTEGTCFAFDSFDEAVEELASTFSGGCLV